MTRIDKAYSLLFHPLRENRSPKRIFKCVSAWIASFGLAPAIVGCIKKHRVRAERQLNVNREIGHSEKNKEALSDEQKERLEEQPKTDFLDVCSAPAINDLLFRFLGDESFKLQTLATPYVNVFLKQKLAKINENPAQSLKALGMHTIDEVIGFTEEHGGEITSLNLSEYTISDEHLGAITRNCPLLRKLNISSPLITNAGIRNFSQNLDQLQELFLNGCFNITDADVRTIVENQRQLTTLSLRDTGITDTGVQSIAKYLKNLKNLDLSDCRIGSEAIKAITENLIELEELNLSGCRRLVNQDVMAIAQCLTNLQGLYLAFTTRLNSEASNLIAERLLKLTHLSLRNCNVTTADVIILSASLKNLKMLNVSNCNISDDGARDISLNLPNLEELYLDNTLISYRGVTHLAQELHQLKTLHLGNRALTSDSILVIAQNLTQLTDLNLSSATIDDEAAAAIVEHLKGLTSLNLCGCDISNSNLQAIIENLRNLKKLNLKLVVGINSQVLHAIATHQKKLEELNLNNTDMKEGFLGIAENLRHLKVLDLSFSRIGSNEARAIARTLTKLEDLNLTHCLNLDTSDFRYLIRNLKNLKSLDLSSNLMNTETIVTIARYQKTLLHLILAETYFRDRGIVSISRNIPTLRVLDLFNCRSITDKGIHAILQNLNLKYLRVDNCEQVTEEARAAVRQALN